MSNPVSMRELLEAGVHFGHQTQRWNPKMKPYIFGARNGVHIIDLQQTVRMFKEAYQFILDRVAEGETIVFVGTKRQAAEVIREEAERAEMYYVNNRWLGGTLTNFQTIKISIENLNELERMFAEGNYPVRTKKEAMMKEKKRQKLLKNISGIRKMSKLPGVIFVVDPKKEAIAIREANKLHIPVVGICDSNCDPEGVDFIIPGNDDAIKSIRLFSRKIAEACIEGKAVRKDKSGAAAGSDAQVREGKRNIDGKKVAVKKIRKTKEEEKAEAETAEAAKAEAAPVAPAEVEANTPAEEKTEKPAE